MTPKIITAAAKKPKRVDKGFSKGGEFTKKEGGRFGARVRKPRVGAQLLSTPTTARTVPSGPSGKSPAQLGAITIPMLRKASDEDVKAIAKTPSTTTRMKAAEKELSRRGIGKPLKPKVLTSEYSKTSSRYPVGHKVKSGSDTIEVRPGVAVEGGTTSYNVTVRDKFGNKVTDTRMTQEQLDSRERLVKMGEANLKDAKAKEARARLTKDAQARNDAAVKKAPTSKNLPPAPAGKKWFHDSDPRRPPVLIDDPAAKPTATELMKIRTANRESSSANNKKVAESAAKNMPAKAPETESQRRERAKLLTPADKAKASDNMLKGMSDEKIKKEMQRPGTSSAVQKRYQAELDKRNPPTASDIGRADIAKKRAAEVNMGNAQKTEDEMLKTLKENPDLAKELDQDKIMRFAKAKQALQLGVMAQDPLGLAPKSDYGPETDKNAKEYVAALADLRANLDELRSDKKKTEGPSTASDIGRADIAKKAPTKSAPYINLSNAELARRLASLERIPRSSMTLAQKTSLRQLKAETRKRG